MEQNMKKVALLLAMMLFAGQAPAYFTWGIGEGMFMDMLPLMKMFNNEELLSS